MIDDCPLLRERVKPARSRDSGNTMLIKEFAGGILVITGSNSAAGLRSTPVRFLFLDEVDAYEKDIEGEGDPIDLAMRRTATYSASRKVFIISTPTIKGASTIENLMDETDRRFFYIPCPHCGVYQTITWGKIEWPEGSPGSAVMICESCTGAIEERRKPELLAAGIWRPTQEGRPGYVGYHLSALYSPLGWYGWGDAATDFLAAKKKGQEALKTFTNTVLAETWEESGKQLAPENLFARREKYAAELPAEALVLTAGVDVQDDRLEMETVAWGEAEQTWGVRYDVFYGDPDTDVPWNKLDEMLEATFTGPDGERLRIAGVGVDSGHKTERVYAYCKARHSTGRVFCLKGTEGVGRPIVSAPAQKRTGRARRPVPLFSVGGYETKLLIMSRLAIEEPGPGYCHFPIGGAYGEEYFKQLTAEKRVTKYFRGFPRPIWVKTRARNEALDCRQYAVAAYYILSPRLDVIRRKLERAKAVDPEPEKTTERPENRRAPARPGRGRGFVRGWGKK
jgi:phage terminase large subunit GpA-like protein